MKIVVNEDFISYRTEKMEQYNQRGRSDRQFAMAIDCELLEWTQIDNRSWFYHPRWEVDAITPEGKHIDVKFISKFWNVSREKTLNLFKQRSIIDEFHFYEWANRPNRPLQAHDCVEVRQVGILSYGMVVDNLRKSFKEPDGFYVPVRQLLGS